MAYNKSERYTVKGTEYIVISAYALYIGMFNIIQTRISLWLYIPTRC